MTNVQPLVKKIQNLPCAAACAEKKVEVQLLQERFYFPCAITVLEKTARSAIYISTVANVGPFLPELDLVVFLGSGIGTGQKIYLFGQKLDPCHQEIQFQFLNTN